MYIQEKWANLHAAWGKRSGPEPDYEDYEAVIEQLLPAQVSAAAASSLTICTMTLL